ncbi:MAG: class I SAM-dependent methyltransferase [Candidatus Rokubacteria bacterium]|nr:class I SAM-dependent methyltransferase [Candidatus Rokubacteria bacterium]MBI3105836.1 class I SAM-dependent methyltransferase [Candidatus Rokubacteria bacterium]
MASNLYDDVRPDVAALLARQAEQLPLPDPGARSADGLGPLGRLASLARLYALGAQVRLGLHRRLVYADLKLAWFHEFQSYWVGELGNRPIHPHDFYYLLGVYRQRLQSASFESLESLDPTSDAKHLEAWRDPRHVYYLFAHAYREALAPLRVHPFVRHLRRGGRVAEYGCGSAPIIAALARRYRHLDLRLVGADLPHLLFHFARWRFRDTRFVSMVEIDAGDDAPLPGQYDAIFCLEVLEHLPRPLPVLHHLHERLRPGGALIFDYVRSEGTGLDTASSLRDRIPALQFILERFDVVEGMVATDGEHVSPAVARKR